jgi:hypothetical protein
LLLALVCATVALPAAGFVPVQAAGSSGSSAPPSVPGGGTSSTIGTAPRCPEVTRATPGVLAAPAHGTAALRKLGTDLAAVARQNCMSARELTRILSSDPTAWLDRDGHMFYVDSPRVPTRAAATTAPQGPFPYANTFLLHSRPTAKRVLYLDFNGHTIANTVWNDQNGFGSTFADAFDIDGNLASFSNAEQDMIQSVWQRVAEDYAPFNVDVTTEDPGLAAIDRTSSTDLNFGTRALITSDDFVFNAVCGRGCGGVAYLDVFDRFGTGTNSHEYWQPALIFSPGGTGADPNGIANTVSHEVGHNFGLNHDGTTLGVEYYDGQGAWSPLMGSGYTRSISQWSKGEYANANNPQDDLAVIASNGAPRAADDHRESDPLNAQTALVNGKAKGVIGTPADVDWFQFVQPCTGTTTIKVFAGAAGKYATNPSPNLDVHSLVYNGSSFIANVDPISGQTAPDRPFGLSTTMSVTVAPGTYYIAVEGVGAGSATVTGYSDYGSLGRFAIKATFPC